MPTPRSLGFDVSYQQCQHKDSKKLAVVCGWMGAKPKQMKPYVNFYLNRGYNVISYAVGPMHVLKPESATEMMDRVLSLAMYGGKGNAEMPTPNQVVTHSFSVGGYLTGQLLRILADADRDADKEKWHQLVKAQIYDSPPDMGSIAKGIGASMGLGAGVAAMVEGIVKAYLYAVKDTAGKEHALSSAHFHDNHIPAPSLWMYSKADPVALESDIDTVMNKWKTKGYEVESTMWLDTKHIQHGRSDPERYFGSLATFLDKHI